MNMLDEYAKITETAKEKTKADENILTDDFVEKLAKKVASVLMQSADGNDNDNDNENENDNENDNENENENDNDNENENE